MSSNDWMFFLGLSCLMIGVTIFSYAGWELDEEAYSIMLEGYQEQSKFCEGETLTWEDYDMCRKLQPPTKDDASILTFWGWVGGVFAFFGIYLLMKQGGWLGQNVTI